jgi:hypothetical protein
MVVSTALEGTGFALSAPHKDRIRPSASMPGGSAALALAGYLFLPPRNQP